MHYTLYGHHLFSVLLSAMLTVPPIHPSQKDNKNMNTIEFIQSTLFELYRSFVTEVEPLTDEEMFYRPTTEANSILFLLWHFPRSGDSAFHAVSTEEDALSVWKRERWYQQFGMQESDSGTGFGPSQVAEFRPNKNLLINYVESVRLSINDGLSSMTESDLDKPLHSNNPRLTVGRHIQSNIIGHGFFHLGEIRFLKGLQGHPFPR